jgi:hypothetical protein
LPRIAQSDCGNRECSEKTLPGAQAVRLAGKAVVRRIDENVVVGHGARKTFNVSRIDAVIEARNDRLVVLEIHEASVT